MRARRGETFVTRKITRGLANIAQGLEQCLYMGNMDALRDWGHAKDYVRTQWMMLQQDAPEDFVIATGQQHSVREFITWSAAELGITLAFEGVEAEEIGRVVAVSGDKSPAVAEGQVLVRVDPQYFRPAEVETSWGIRQGQGKAWLDPGNHRAGAVRRDGGRGSATAQRHAFLKANGFGFPVAVEI